MDSIILDNRTPLFQVFLQTNRAKKTEYFLLQICTSNECHPLFA